MFLIIVLPLFIHRQFEIVVKWSECMRVPACLQAKRWIDREHHSNQTWFLSTRLLALRDRRWSFTTASVLSRWVRILGLFFRAKQAISNSSVMSTQTDWRNMEPSLCELRSRKLIKERFSFAIKQITTQIDLRSTWANLGGQPFFLIDSLISFN